MSRLSLWTPAVLVTWLLLWPLVIVARPLKLALDPVQLTSEHQGLTEPPSLRPSDLPPESPHVFTTRAVMGSFNMLGSSAVAHMVASLQELIETSVPSPDADGELPSGPDQFAVGLQDPKDKQEALTQPLEPAEEIKASPLQLEAQPLQAPEEIQPISPQQEAPAEPAEPHEEVMSSSGQQEASPQSLEHLGDKPSLIQEEASSQMLEPPNEPEWPPTQQETPAQFPGVAGPSATLQEQPAQPPERKGMRVSTPVQPPEFSMGVPAQPSVHPEVTFSPLDPGEAHQTRSSIIGVKPVDLGLFITPKPIEEVKTPSQQEAPPQTPKKMEPSLVHQQAQQQSPEPPEEAVILHPIHNEEILSRSGQNEATHSHGPTVTVQPLHMGLTKTSELVTGFQYSTALTKTVTPPKSNEVTLPNREQVQAEQPNLNEITIKPLNLELTITTGSSVEAETSPIKQDTPTQPPKPLKEGAAQPPLYREVTVPNSSQHQDEHQMSPCLTGHPLDLGLTVTAEPTTEAEPSAALTETAGPSPRHLEVTLSHPEQVQDQHPKPTEVAVQPADLEVTVSQPESVETLAQKTEPRASRKPDICEVCKCNDGTLSCTGLSPEQKLRSVPVLESHIYQGTFTVVNLQGNSISYIDENTWKSYRWVETLILSENNLSELRKDSFEGLLSLQYLDLSCNKIESIERRTFAPLPFLQFINLGCNSITELNFGTFQAWHEMQFLDKVILHRNPLTTIEDVYLFKLPALRYLDMGRTQVSLATVESILMMSLALEKLILPSRMTCCLCQFKSDIEVACKTVKLHCDSKCPIDITHCDEIIIRNAEGPLMKVLQARKKSTNTKLTIEPERPSSDDDDINLSAFRNNQVDISDESDVINALNYILPYFSKGNLGDVQSTLLPLIKLLYTNTEDDDMPLSHLTNTRSRSLNPESNDAMYQNRLMKLYSLENLLRAEIQEKIDEVKKKENTAMLIHSKLLGPQLKGETFQKQLDTDWAQDKSPAKIQSVQKKPLRVNRVIKGPKGIRKRYFKELATQGNWRNQNAQPNVENTFKEGRRRRPPPRELEQLHLVHRPGKSMRHSFNAEPSFIKKNEDAVSSTLKQYLIGSPSDSTDLKSLSEVKKSKDLSDTTFILDEANARVRNMKASKPISHSIKKHLFRKGRSHVTSAKAKGSQEFGTDDSLKSLMLARRPPMSAERTLINSPAREAFSYSGEQTSHENPPPELSSHWETSKGKSTTQTPFKESIQKVMESIHKESTGTTTGPEKTIPEIPAQESPSITNSAVTIDKFMPTANPFSSTDITSPLFSSADDQFEKQLNQQLQSLIPNNDIRKLTAHIISILRTDCSEASVRLPCARLISRTGLLMKLLSKQQEVMVSKTEWDTDQWKNDNYISESTEAQSKHKGQGPLERTKEVLGYISYHKFTLATPVAILVMVLIMCFCLIGIHSCKKKSEARKKGSSRGFFRLLHEKSSTENDSQKRSDSRMQPLWLQDIYTPMNDTVRENLARKLGKPDSSDEEEETTDKEKGELTEVVTEDSSVIQ